MNVRFGIDKPIPAAIPRAFRLRLFCFTFAAAAADTEYIGIARYAKAGWLQYAFYDIPHFPLLLRLLFRLLFYYITTPLAKAD